MYIELILSNLINALTIWLIHQLQLQSNKWIKKSSINPP
jgi:hypothetical protein